MGQHLDWADPNGSVPGLGWTEWVNPLDIGLDSWVLNPTRSLICPDPHFFMGRNPKIKPSRHPCWVPPPFLMPAAAVLYAAATKSRCSTATTPASRRFPKPRRPTRATGDNDEEGPLSAASPCTKTVSWAALVIGRPREAASPRTATTPTPYRPPLRRQTARSPFTKGAALLGYYYCNGRHFLDRRLRHRKRPPEAPSAR